jgi:hypothetical protein
LTGREPARLSGVSEVSLRNFEIIAALLLALILFVVLKVIGLVVKFALIAAALGFVAGLLLARSFRR